MQESLVMCLNGSETMPDQGHILAKNPMNRVIYSELSPSARSMLELAELDG